ncbi:MAG: sugar phosphate nucleotidyltransferase [Acidimicrobiales bacterium]
MDAVVLVGGFGTRLRPLTLTTPKQMLPVLDRPMIEWVMAGLAAHGISRAVLSLGFLPDSFTAAYPQGSCAGVELVYAVEPEPLDTAGAIAFAARFAGVADTFVALNGDVLTELDLTELVRIHRQRGAEGTLALTPVEDPSRYGVVPIDGEGRVEAFVEKPEPGTAPSHWINAGSYVLEPAVLERIPAGRRVSIERETFPAMAADRVLYAVQSEAYWIDTGTPQSYVQAQLDLVGRLLGPGSSFLDPSAKVAPGAEVTESVVMRDATVEAGAAVRRSCVLPGARVAAGARLEDSILGPAAVLGEGAELGDFTIVGEGQPIAPGTVLAGGRVPNG